MSDVKKLFHLAEQILPSSDVLEKNPSLILKNCVAAYLANSLDEKIIQNVNNIEVHEAFYKCCLDFMHKCSNVCKVCSPEDCAMLFSIHQEKQLVKVMEFIVCLGIYPLIDPGVSLPLELRLESHQYFNCPKVSNDEHRNVKLMEISNCFLELIQSNSPQLQRLVSPSLFLGDLIAILMQVAFGPNPLPKLNPNNENSRLICREAYTTLWRLLCDLPGHVAMKELLILQGGSRAGSEKIKGAVPLPPAPVWLRKSCGRLLSRLLVCGCSITPISSAKQDHEGSRRSDGVQQLILAATSLTPAVISSGSGPISSIDPRCQPALASALARILSSPPSFLNRCPIDSQLKSDNSSVKNYYKNISEQVLQLLSFPVKTPKQDSDQDYGSVAIARFGYLVALTTVHEMCKTVPKISNDLILWPLIGLLRKLVIPTSISQDDKYVKDESVCSIPDGSDEVLLASSEDLTLMIKYYMDLLECPNRSAAVMKSLISYSRPIFYLLAQVIQDDATDGHSEQQSHNLVKLKQQLLALLSRLLSVAIESPSDRLSVVRSWLGLNDLPTVDFNAKQSENSPRENFHPSLTSLPCLPRLAYRSTWKIQLIYPETNNKSVNIDLQIPYICVLTTELIRITTEPQTWSLLISTLIELLKFMYPDQHNAESDELAPHIRKLLSDQNESTTENGEEQSSLPSDLFMSLIQDLNTRLIDSDKSDSNLLQSIVNSESNDRQDTEKGIISSLLASAMLEHLGDLIWPQKVSCAVDLFEMTLDRFCLISQNLSNCPLEEFVQEALSQLLGILAFYINQLKPTSSSHSSSDRDQFARLVPRLDKLQAFLGSHNPSNFSAQLELIQSLRASLLTRGAIPVTVSNFGSTIDSPKPINEENSPNLFSVPTGSTPIQSLIKEIPTITESAEPQSDNQFSETLDPLLKQTLEELKDPLLPVRGHALIVLSRLLESRDSRITGHEEHIFQILVRHLMDSDSYIYLNAIRALSAMGQAYTDRVLHVLLQRFYVSSSASTQTKVSETDPDPVSSVEYRLKLGESIMRIIRDLGQMAPKYRAPVMQTLTIGSKDTEPLVRAACLSNLAEFVKLLQHAIAPVVYEVFSIIEFHLTQDSSPLARKAAAFLARSLFMSETKDSKLPEWIPPDMLRDLNRLLSTRRSIEKDITVSEQIESALAEMDKCARESVFLKTDSPANLIKEIRILHP